MVRKINSTLLHNGFFAFVFIFVFNEGNAQNILQKEFAESTLSDSKKTEIEHSLRNLPACFRKNMGQWNDDILFESSFSGVHMYFMKDGISYANIRAAENEMPGTLNTEPDFPGNNKHEYLVWNMKFAGCNKNVRCSSEGEQKSKINYLIGNDPSRFVTNAPDYHLIRYHELYNNIDARYYVSGNKIKYDYLVKPDGNIGQIKICSGGTTGSAIANPGGGSPPYIYVWNTGQTSQTITGLAAGNYTVTVVDTKGCTTVTTAAVTSPQPLVGQFTKGTANCAGCLPAGQAGGCKEWMMVNASGGTSPYSYTWPDGYVNRYKNQLCPGAYTINVKDKNGCSINVNLTAP